MLRTLSVMPKSSQPTEYAARSTVSKSADANRQSVGLFYASLCQRPQLPRQLGVAVVLAHMLDGVLDIVAHG